MDKEHLSVDLFRDVPEEYRKSQGEGWLELTNGLTLLDDGHYNFTEEEIAEANAKERVDNDAGVQKALADGHIEVPVFWHDLEGHPVEMKAWVPPTYTPSCSEEFLEKHGNAYNIYVPSYGRAGAAPTIDVLKLHNIENWYLMVDPSQYEAYRDVYGSERVILRDIRFRDPKYVYLASSEKRPNSMSGTAGIYNNLLSFSRTMGERKYWTMDDDFVGLAMKAHMGDEDANLARDGYVKEDYYRCSRIIPEYGFDFSSFLRNMEVVGESTRNHGFLGLEKFGAVFTFRVHWKFGTRVYSFYLSDNKTQPDHIGAMNNDVIASLEQSKRGMPPGLLEGIGYNSMATQAGNGGLSDQYLYLGTLEKGKTLVKCVPNFMRIAVKFNRIHHVGNFAHNQKLKLKPAPISDPNSPLTGSE